MWLIGGRQLGYGSLKPGGDIVGACCEYGGPRLWGGRFSTSARLGGQRRHLEPFATGEVLARNGGALLLLLP